MSVEVKNTTIMYAVETEKITKKKPQFGALPMLNMPSKTHETKKLTS